MRLRDDYSQDCVKGMLRWNKVVRPRATLPAQAAQRRFHRHIGEFKGIHATRMAFDRRCHLGQAQGYWLPSTADGRLHYLG